MFGLEFTSKFPYLRKIVVRYQNFELGDSDEFDYYQSFVKEYRKILLENQVPINKVRFVFKPTFTYDVDNNVVNPKYNIMLPIDQNTGIMSSNHPIIEIGKPEHLITVSVKTYKYLDNFALLKERLKKNSRGIVIYQIDYDAVRFADLDEEVLNYNIE